MNFPLSDNHKRDLLYTEMRKSDGLKLPLVKYTDTKTDDRTYDQLCEIMNKWLSEVKEERLLKAEMRDTQSKAYPFYERKNGKGKDGGKGKGKGDKGKGKGDESKDEHPKGDKGDKGKGKGGKGKGKGKKEDASVPDVPWPKTAEERRKTKCAYFQTKFNGGWTCSRGDDCGFDHTECASAKEYRQLPKPTRLTPPGSRVHSPRPSPRNRSEAHGSLPRESHEAVTSDSKTPIQCPHGANCKGAPPPVGDGSCKNIHG